ncbi:Tyrosine recombinase XerC [Gossypium arboreum]|uniref:Tyrosine recombinase XerC n=1 Tax=Gossypium arboreum TaxID=29729 RepID=A0A0B0N2L7_GOSAR|nr:Tyrosine recombinase XerC [Gossypium arboreum]
MHTHIFNGIQQGINEHLNIHKHVMIMAISHATNIIGFTNPIINISQYIWLKKISHTQIFKLLYMLWTKST